MNPCAQVSSFCFNLLRIPPERQEGCTRITRLFLVIISLASIGMISSGFCHFHLPQWSTYAGIGAFVISSILFTLTLHSIPFTTNENLICNDSEFGEKFIQLMEKYPLHRSRHLHIIFASFNGSEAHNVFEAGGVLFHEYKNNDNMQSWRSGSILLVFCARDEQATEELFNDPNWIPGQIEGSTNLSAFKEKKQPKVIGLNDHEVALINGGCLPAKLRFELFGYLGGTFSYLL